MKCPICHEPVKKDQHYCTNCGRDLTKPTTWHCPNCLGDITQYDREIMEYCPLCGKSVRDNFLVDEEAEEKRKKRGRKKKLR